MLEVPLVPLAVPLLRAGYREVLRKRGTAVYQRPGPGQIEIAADGSFCAPAQRLLELLLDYGRHPKLFDGLAMSQVLVKRPTHLLVYQRLDIPWVSDRDYTLRVTWGRDRDVLWLQFHCAPRGGPAPKRNVVRVRHNQGGWLIHPEGRRRCRARYQLSLDLGGALPGWLVQSKPGDLVPKMFGAINKQLGRG